MIPLLIDLLRGIASQVADSRRASGVLRERPEKYIRKVLPVSPR